LDSLIERSKYVTLEKHVFVGALALGLPYREVLWSSYEHVSFRVLTLGLPNGEILIRDT
jgi:hypothetical protein